MKSSHESVNGTRQQPGGRGKAYWRGLEDLAQSDAFREMLEREFPDQASEWIDAITRRRFLTLMGASLALAGLTGCGTRPPIGQIVPYVRQPAGMVPGKALYFATAMTLAGQAIGLLAESHEGRPTKIEGNPDHPASLGATNAFAQASILGLYDPDRSQSMIYRGRSRGWSQFLADSTIQRTLENQRNRRGAGLRVLTETVASPTLADQLIGDHAASLRGMFPEARWHQYDAARSNNVDAGVILVFGAPLNTVYNFADAKVVVALDADFLGSGPAHVRYVRDFMKGRRLTGAPESAAMNRLYALECMPSPTGAVADHRLRLRAGEVEAFARALGAALGMNEVRTPAIPEQARRWIQPLTKDLEEHRGASLIVAGEAQPPYVHALAHALNRGLGNVGKTVLYTDPVEARPVHHLDELRELIADMSAGRVEMLLILGANPVYSSPADLEFERALQQVPLRIHLGLYQDETASHCHWHIPEAHFLESWSDARAFDGTASIVQPLIAPLFGGRTVHELLAALLGDNVSDGYSIVRRYWRSRFPAGSDFERQWRTALHDGVIAGTKFKTVDPKPRNDWIAQPPAEWRDEGLEIVFRPDPTIHDGRFANNGWLQELPKPITKITWDNAAFLSPATAEQYGLSQNVGSRGGEHGEAIVDVVELTYRERVVLAPVGILPGHADGSITVHLGYGRTRAGRVGGDAEHPVGFNAYQLRDSAAPWFDHGLSIRRIGKHYTLACTQMHHRMEDRAPVRTATLGEYQQQPNFAHGEHDAPIPQPSEAPGASEGGRRPLTLYPEHDYAPPKQRWGMAIDLAACTGCSACVVACQAENNIPVVGKSEVTRGREMHWLRIDRYYDGDPAEPETYFQPVPCMQCENAPCEVVCPTMATVHSADGLNDMVYNRCIGTRYCSNGCPYKVRRFNFLSYADFTTASFKLMHNPDVTVRSRGVMEKCTYCVQRIRAAQIEAEVQGRPLRDGDVLTACQAACPAEAIVFGDMNDPKSRVSKLKNQPRNYGLLAGLNTRPRTTYLAAIRNPNPELAET